MLFSRWHGRVLGGLARESWRPVSLCMEELENRTVFHAGVSILPAPVAAPLAVEIATLAREASPPSESPTTYSVNVADTADFQSLRQAVDLAAANPPVGFGAGPQPAEQPTLNRPDVKAESSPFFTSAEADRTESAIATTPMSGYLVNQPVGRFNMSLGGKPEGTDGGPFDGRFADPFMRINEYPLFASFRFLAPHTPPDELPLQPASPRPAIDPPPLSPATDTDETGSETIPVRATPPAQPALLILQLFGSSVQTIFADLRGYAPPARTGREDATPYLLAHMEDAGASIPIQSQSDRDVTETIPDATTTPETNPFIPDAAGILIGCLPFRLAAIGRALRELQPEETTVASAVPPCLRVFGLGAWLVSALAYFAARQRWKRTTDFDDLTALREIALKNKDQS